MQPSSQEVARAMFKRTMSAHRPARVSVSRALKLRADLVTVLEPGMQGLLKWFSERPDDWSFPEMRRPRIPEMRCSRNA